MKYIAISRYGWGQSTDQTKAVKLCKKNAPHGTRHKKGEIKVYRAVNDVDVYGDGSWAYPEGKQPKLIETL